MAQTILTIFFLLKICKQYKEPNVVVVNEQNICNFTIDDVVLPLPGHLIIYPENALGEKYVELMGRDKLDANNMTRNVRYVRL